MSLEDSIKAKLRNRAILENRTFNEVLTIYGLERLLYRLSSSKYNDNFVLKGGIILYASTKVNLKEELLMLIYLDILYQMMWTQSQIYS
ncbi:MAG: hypothetical protein RBQ91_07040 [Acholeplasma sp.]|nr:hypothetical protein [Acholeplasma sp.]